VRCFVVPVERVVEVDVLVPVGVVITCMAVGSPGSVRGVVIEQPEDVVATPGGELDGWPYVLVLAVAVAVVPPPGGVLLLAAPPAPTRLLPAIVEDVVRAVEVVVVVVMVVVVVVAEGERG
jgi:hypothetical protein